MSYFSDDELRCKCGCGNLLFDDEVREKLDAIREAVGFPMPVTSGYRCPDHPIEAAKEARGRPVGAHCSGKAVDIGVERERAHRLIQTALEHNCPRIGVNQRGDGRFIHLDWDYTRPNPTIWSY